MVLNVQMQNLEGDGLDDGGSIILTFAVGTGRKRTDPITCAPGRSTKLVSKVQIKVPERARILNVELHKIIGEGKTRVIGKGMLNMAGNLLPRMSGGREAEEVIEMKGNLKGGAPAKQVLSVMLQLIEIREEEMWENLEINRERIRRAMKRQERKARLRTTVEHTSRIYESKFKGKDRPFNIDAVRAYNLPEDFSSKEDPKGVQFRIRTPAWKQGDKPVVGLHVGSASRIMSGTRHPAFSQCLRVNAEGEVDLVLEDRKNNIKLGMAPFPVKEVPLGKSYLADLVLDDKGTHLLAIVNPVLTSQDMYDKLMEDSTLEHLQIECPAILDHHLVLRFRLCGASDDVVADWNESDDHDGELEPLPVRLSYEDIDEEGFTALRELTDEMVEDGVVEQLVALTTTSANQLHAPPNRGVSFTERDVKEKYLLCEIYTTEEVEVDADTGEENEVDAPEMVFLAAWMTALTDFHTMKDIRQLEEGIKYREMTLNLEMRVSEDITELLPSGVSLPREFAVTLRLWDANTLMLKMNSTLKTEVDRKTGFDSWVGQLKLVSVEELMMMDVLESISLNAYELQVQQGDHVLPDVDMKTFLTTNKDELFSSSKSVPSSPTAARAKDPYKLQRPKTVGVIRRNARPEVQTRPVTPITFTKEAVDRMIAAAVAAAEARMRNQMEKQRLEALDRVDVLSSSIGNLTAEKTRFQRELDERSEAIRKCGVEIMELRKHIKTLVADKSALQEALAEKEAIEQEMLIIDDSLEMLDRGDLEKRLKLLSASYKEERSKNTQLLAKMKLMHSDLIRVEELQRAHKALQDAHGEQGVKMKELQSKNAKLSKYVVTVQQQEQVIEKLEGMMEKALSEAREANNYKAQRDSLQNKLDKVSKELASLQKMSDGTQVESAKAHADEIARLEAKIKGLEAAAQNASPPEEIKKLEDKIKELEDEKKELQKKMEDLEKKPKPKPKGPDAAASERDKLMLLMRAEKAESRIRAVETQMTTNSKKFAAEIAGLKSRLQDLGQSV